MSFRISFVMLLLFAVGGCQLAVPRVVDLRPPWLQRRQLQRFDPYPDNDIAPKIEGGRPPGFQQQLNETKRARWVLPHPPSPVVAPNGL